MRDFRFTTKDFILYLLSKIDASKHDLIYLNKIAFFVEFGFIATQKRALSDTTFAAIDLGPVIDGYKSTLREMKKDGLVRLDGFRIKPLKYPSSDVPEEIRSTVDPLIEKYSLLNRDELISLSHDTDSFKITSNNERGKGNEIDKDLAFLETFFGDDLRGSDGELDEKKLPKYHESDLVEYGL